jgi:multicomponent Na+:H+ antiporter subunit B
MLSGIFSLLCAGLFTVMDAVDVAFTEAAVGAGISTVLMLAALSMTNSKEKVHPTNWGALIVAVLTGALLVYGTQDMPSYGDPGAPVHNHIAKRYIETSLVEIDVPNMVTSLLASYRGFDTLGETTVVLTACIGVLLLLGGRRREEDDHEGS